MRAEGERCDDPEAPRAASAQGPVQVLAAALGAAEALPGGRDDVGGEDAVAGEAELPRGEAVPAAEGKAGDADGRAGPRGNRPPGLPEGRVHRLEARARADLRGAVWTELYRREPRQVDDEPARRGVAAVRVPARTGGDARAVPLGPADAPLHVQRVLRERDGERPDGVVPRVLDEPRRRVAAAAAHDEVAVEVAGELAEPAVGCSRRGRREAAGGPGGSRGDHGPASREELAPVEPVVH
jgi:hypothetical protein